MRDTENIKIPTLINIGLVGFKKGLIVRREVITTINF